MRAGTALTTTHSRRRSASQAASSTQISALVLSSSGSRAKVRVAVAASERLLPSARATVARSVRLPKNERDNIRDDELARWHEVATAYLQSGPHELEALTKADELREVLCNG